MVDSLVLYGFKIPNWQLDAVMRNMERRKENRPVKKENSDS